MEHAFKVHVLDDDHARRAQIARYAYALGLHAEVYEDAEELAAHAPSGGVIIALEDAVRGGVSGLLRILNREGRWLAVIATSREPTIDKAVQAMKEGALHYLPLPLDEQGFGEVIGAVSEQAEVLRERHERRSVARRKIALLSPRERDVVSLMAEGLTNKEIGRSLGISPRTVEIHRNNALQKLAARHSAQALRIWLEASDEAAAA